MHRLVTNNFTGPSPHILKWFGGRQSEGRSRAGESTRGGCPLSLGGFGGSPPKKFDLWVPLSVFFMHFGCVLGQNSSSVVLAEIFGQNSI